VRAQHEGAGRHEAQVRERFDAWSASGTFRRLSPWLVAVQRRVLDRIDWSRATAVLDVGCGSGWAVSKAAARLHRAGRGGALACGCDISEGMLRRRAADPGQPDTAAFVAASAQALPYRDGSFDAVICTAAFHHFPAPAEALREFRRVLRPGGRVLIAETCRDRSVGTWVWDRLHRWFEKGHLVYYRTDELRRLLDAAGFASVEVTPITPSYAEAKKLVRGATLFSAIAPGTGAGWAGSRASRGVPPVSSARPAGLAG
jgi:ubiquinone/menaquinone biosynthesis C-methylase UbiE